jgi:protoporphyrinogen/coproporphyrinogen III oxidase
MKVAIVGGGLSGLAIANRLLEIAPELEITILEASARAGGILGTIERDGFVIETGPDAILSEKREAIELAERLGLAERIVSTNDANRGAYVVCRGRLEKVPEGFSLMAPARFDTWLESEIVSLPGRMRALLEPLIPRARGETNGVSLAEFVERRLGREVLDRLAQPLVSGIYGGDPRRLDLSATMPRFVELEKKYGSIVRGMRRSSDRAASGARYGLFVAFDRGMQVLVDALLARVGDRVRLESPAIAIERSGSGYDVILEKKGQIHADRVVLASGAWRAATLLEPHHKKLSDALHSIEHGSAATVTFAWPRERVPHPMEAFGFVVPAIERRAIHAATFASVKWPHRAPEGRALIRVFIGGAHAKSAVDRSDAELIALARRELRALMHIEAPPEFSLVVRYRDAMPQYQLGHRAKVDAILKMERELEGLFVAGNALRGVGIPDTIRRAQDVAARIAESV